MKVVYWNVQGAKKHKFKEEIKVWNRKINPEYSYPTRNNGEQI